MCVRKSGEMMQACSIWEYPCVLYRKVLCEFGYVIAIRADLSHTQTSVTKQFSLRFYIRKSETTRHCVSLNMNSIEKCFERKL